MKRVGLLVAYLALCIVACLAYFYLRNHVNLPIAPESLVERIVIILIAVAIGFALGMWRRGNPWYVYVVAVLICLVTEWMAYFSTGLFCDYVAKCM